MAIKFPRLSMGRKASSDESAAVDETLPPAKYGFFQLGLLLAILAGAAIVGTGYLFQSQAADSIQDSRKREMKLIADNLAGRIADLMVQRTEKMALLARDPELIQLLTTGQSDRLRDKEAQLAYLFPRAVKVRLLPPGLDEVDMDASPPISYAVLDMVRQAETQETPPPAEVHLSNTPQQHINVIRRILSENGRRIVGHLLVSLPVPLMQEAMDAAKTASGYGEIWQNSGQGQVTLASHGQRSLKSGNPTVKVPVPNTRWEIAYWSATGGLALDPTGLIIVAGSATVIFALLLWLLLRWYGAMLKQDHTALLAAVRDGLSGGLRADGYEIQLKESRNTLSSLYRLFDSGASSPRPTGSAGLERMVEGMARESAAQSAPDATAPVDFGVLDDGALGGGVAPVVTQSSLDSSIFRAYDIRGVVGDTLTPDVVFLIGKAIGSEAAERGEQAMVVARDGRLSSPEISEALIRGLRATGQNVKDLGAVPTPVLYFATHYLDAQSGVMVTGSHNPADYNGMKIVLAGETLSGDAIQGLRERIERAAFTEGQGALESIDIIEDYIERIRSDVQVSRPVKVVLDCGNGIASALAPRLLETLGCEVTPLFCDVDGSFPNHHPDPSRPENLTALIEAVKSQGADIGVALDGDGDRIGIVDSEGEIIWPDRLLMLFAMDVLSRNPGADIIYDVKSSRHLEKIVRDFGGSPEMWRSGHSLMKARMKETGAILGGEMSGHVFFQERWYGFDDALYATARLMEILANDHRSSSGVFGMLPHGVSTPELHIPLAEGEPQEIMDKFLGSAQFPGAEITTLDGLRADFPQGWGLLRASNTMPYLVLRFEADDEAALAEIQNQFRAAIQSVAPELALPF